MPDHRSHGEDGDHHRAVDAPQRLTMLFLIGGYSAWFVCVYVATLLDGP